MKKTKKLKKEMTYKNIPEWLCKNFKCSLTPVRKTQVISLALISPTNTFYHGDSRAFTYFRFYCCYRSTLPADYPWR